MEKTLRTKHYVQSTSKGQVTLPITIRRELAINPSTLLNVTVEHGRVVIEPVIDEPKTAEQWEPVIDFTQVSPGGVALETLQRRLKTWTKSTKR